MNLVRKWMEFSPGIGNPQTPNKWTRNVALLIIWSHMIIYVWIFIKLASVFWYLWGLQPSNHPCGIIGVSLDSLMASSHLKRSVTCLLNRDLVPKMSKYPQSHILGQDFFTYHSSKFRGSKNRLHDIHRVLFVWSSAKESRFQTSARARRRGCFKTFPWA